MMLKKRGGVVMEQRLAELRAEAEKGQRELEALDHRRQELRDTMLRIGGAIQVLQELIADRERCTQMSSVGSEAAVAGALAE